MGTTPITRSEPVSETSRTAGIQVLNGFYIVLFLFNPIVSFAASQEVYRGRLTVDLSHPIKGLSWNKDRETQEPMIHRCKAMSEVTGSDPSTEKDVYCVQLQGEYSSKTRHLRLNARSFNIDLSGKFTAEYPIKANPSEFVLQTVGQDEAKKEEQKIKVYVQNWEKFSQMVSGSLPRPSSKFSITPGVGVSYITYQQTGLTPFSEWAITGKLSANYVLGRGWYLNASGAFNVATFAPAPAGSQLNVVTVDAKVGYQISSRGSPWGFSVLGGWNYISSFNAPGGSFGFVDMMGPELMFLASYRMSSEQQLFIYFRPNLITSMDPISTQNIEYAEGLGYFLSPTYGLTLDLAQLSFQSGGSTVQSNSCTFAFNLRF